jgi:uncharacterized protein
MIVFLAGLAMVLVIEGLVLALLPDRLDQMLRAIASIPPETRRVLGLATAATGAVMLWLLLS